jgi:L-serine dehydratase
MSLTAFGESAELFTQTYYSVGGGFIIEAAQAESGVAPAGDVVLPYDFPAPPNCSACASSTTCACRS